MKRPILIASAAALALTAAAAAQPPMLKDGPGGGFGLLTFDANADGKLTRAEFDAGQRARFDAIDANKDGAATPEEKQAAFDARRAEAGKARFVALDTDRNGQLSEAEFAAVRDRGPGPDGPRLRLGGRAGPGDPGGPGGFERGGRIGPDSDNDGKVSFAEFSARGAEAFARADADKDGTVTIAELQALPR